MSERPIDINATKSGTASDVISSDEKELARKQKKARLAQALTRGIVSTRLEVELPPDKVGQWVPINSEHIPRLRALGFEIDREFAAAKFNSPDSGHKTNDKGDGAAYIGDVVFMTADRETREIIDEIKLERYKAMNVPVGGQQKEERDFAAMNQTLTGAHIGTTVASDVRKVSKEEIAASLKPNLPI